MRKLRILSEVEDQSTGTVYQLLGHLGQGGFGTAYHAVELTRSGKRKSGTDCCLKLSMQADIWHGEVYFGSLLRDVGHVVEMKSSFTTSILEGGSRKTAYAITMELVKDGTVRDVCQQGPWTEQQVLSRVRSFLKPLELLHNMGVSHRDVTPPNVFVGNKKVLKLGDFGITKAKLLTKGVKADVLNLAFAPKDLGTFWTTADDVYQLGLLMATLVSGQEVYTGVGKVDINQITGKGQLRDVIKAAISVKAQRPQTAADLAKLMR